MIWGQSHCLQDPSRASWQTPLSLSPLLTAVDRQYLDRTAGAGLWLSHMAVCWPTVLSSSCFCTAQSNFKIITKIPNNNSFLITFKIRFVFEKYIRWHWCCLITAVSESWAHTWAVSTQPKRIFSTRVSLAFPDRLKYPLLMLKHTPQRTCIFLRLDTFCW